MATKKVSKEDVVEFIKNMTVMELADFIKELEEIFGVSAAQITPAAPVITQEVEPVKETFTVTLIGYEDTKKIPVIKAIRAVLPLGLKDAKDFVEGAPMVIKEEANKEEIETIKKILIPEGAKIEIK